MRIERYRLDASHLRKAWSAAPAVISLLPFTVQSLPIKFTVDCLLYFLIAFFMLKLLLRCFCCFVSVILLQFSCWLDSDVIHVSASFANKWYKLATYTFPWTWSLCRPSFSQQWHWLFMNRFCSMVDDSPELRWVSKLLIYNSQIGRASCRERV